MSKENMKQHRRIIAALVAVSLLEGIFPSHGVLAAKKIHLNKNKVTLTVGKTTKLLLKNCRTKVKWKSSKKKVAAVTKKGVVTAKKKGTAKITAIAGKKKYICKVTVTKKEKGKQEVNPTGTPVQSENPVSTPMQSAHPTYSPMQSDAPVSHPPVFSPDATRHPEAGKLIYDLQKETGANPVTGESFAPPVVCSYAYFKYHYYRIWLCQAVLYADKFDPSGVDYRGAELEYTITLKNTGENDLPELGFCTLQSKGRDIVEGEGEYPYMFHVIDTGVWNERCAAKEIEKDESALRTDARHRSTTVVNSEIKAGQAYRYRFKYTIPEDAENGDKDPDTGVNYPILMFIDNCRGASLYQSGDEITIYDCKIRISDGTPIENPVEQVADTDLPVSGEKGEEADEEENMY